MAQLKEVTFEYGLTLNAGNYESIRVASSASATVEPGETYADALKKVSDMIVPEVTALGARMKRARTSGITETTGKVGAVTVRRTQPR
jgi:hypothetical protein